MDVAETQISALGLFRSDVDAAVTAKDIVDVVEESTRITALDEVVADYHHTLFENAGPGKVPDPHANFQSFSAYLKADFDVHGIASCGSCPHNPRQFGLPYLMGVIVLNDRRNGAPLAVIEMSRLVEFVTAAVSAVGAKHLSNQHAEVLGILGCGNQGRTHVDAIRAVRDIKQIMAFDLNQEALAKFASDITEKTGVPVTKAESAETAIRESDVLAVLISSPVPTVRFGWIKAGALVIAASGFGQELHKEECYRNADRIVMDEWGSYVDATLDDVGATDEDRRVDRILINNWKEWRNGSDLSDSKDRLLASEYGLELPKIIVGQQQGRESAEDKIIFLHAGMSQNMVAAGYLVWKQAKEKGLGTEFRIL